MIFLVADMIPKPKALQKYMNYFMIEEGRNIAAITANTDVQNRTRIIEKSQTVEFSSLGGTIKRGQIGTLSTMYAYNGANPLYRKWAMMERFLFWRNTHQEPIKTSEGRLKENL